MCVFQRGCTLRVAEVTATAGCWEDCQPPAICVLAMQAGSPFERVLAHLPEGSRMQPPHCSTPLARLCKLLQIVLTLQLGRCWIHSQLASHRHIALQRTCHLQGSLTQEKAKSRMLMSRLTTLETEFYAIQDDLHEYSQSVEV